MVSKKSRRLKQHLNSLSQTLKISSGILHDGPNRRSYRTLCIDILQSHHEKGKCHVFGGDDDRLSSHTSLNKETRDALSYISLCLIASL